MGKDNQVLQPQPQPAAREGVISIIGPGMRVVGDCEADGTLRIEGTVEGMVRATKAVVIGKDGVVKGDVVTQDAVIGGRVTGSIIAESRLELQATCVIEGEIRARRIRLDEGGRVNGNVFTGEVVAKAPTQPGAPGPAARPAGPEAKPAAAEPGKVAAGH